MTEQQNTNYDPDPFDNDFVLGAASPVRVTIAGDEMHPWHGVNDEHYVEYVDIPGPQYSGSGAMVFPGPTPGFKWDVKMITVAGYSAGTVQLWKNDLVNPSSQRFTFPAGGETITPGKCAFVLSPNDTIYFVPVGLTGTISVTLGVMRVRREAFSEYAA
jgi:hypothetical protein